MKKLLFVLTTVFFLLTSQNLTSFAFYSDVDETTPYYKSIQALDDLNLLPKDEKFEPNTPITTPELIKILLAYKKVSPNNSPKLPFSDLNNDSKYAPYLQKAIDLGIIRPFGLKPEIFPNQSLAKHRVLETLFTSLGLGTDYFFSRELFPFKDLDPNSDIAPLAKKAQEIGIFEENPAMFMMAKRITKGELANYLYLIHEYNPSTSEGILQVQIIPIDTDITRDTNGNNSQYNDVENQLIDNENFATLLDVWQSLKTDYLLKKDLKDADLIYGAIEGLAKEANDPYTIFEKPNKAGAFLDNLSSEYEGIGVSIETIDNDLTIIAPFKDSPAEKAGLKAKDIIIKVNDKDITGTPTEEVINMIKGKKGTVVKLTILRDKQSLDFTITRANISHKTVTVKYVTKGNKTIAEISLLTFGEGTYKEFLTAAQEIVNKRANGIILDLRNNPGGYMSTAIDITGLFTKDQKVALKLTDADGNTVEEKTTGNGLLDGIKTIVLVNKGSASASEILAGALQDHGLATLMGETTFGKGTVQELKQYSDDSLFKYTISKWLTPKGTWVNKKGIDPDIQVSDTSTGEIDNMMVKALEEF